MRKDWNKVMLGSLVGLGALAIFHFGRPAKDRAGPGDKVFVKDDKTGLTFEMLVRAVTSTSVTGIPTAGQSVANIEITVPRDRIVGFSK